MLVSTSNTDGRGKIWSLDRNNKFFEHELMKNDDIFFKQNLRMNKNSFKDLCGLLPGLEKKEMQFRETIPLDKRIAIALYALGSAAEYRTVANVFGIGRSTVCEILLEFCTEVWDQLKPLYFNYYPLTDFTIKKNIEGFEKLGFPQCIGAIDGTHIEIKPPKLDATDYFNYKGWYSMLLLAVVDHRYNFMYINVGCPGRCNDSKVFEESLLKKQHSRDNPILYRNVKMIGSVEVPPLLIADSAFRLTKFVTKPYPFKIEGDHGEKVFNYHLSKCRRVVENSFGHLKARFRRIGKGVDNRIDKVPIIIKACCILHNFLNSKRDEVNILWIRQMLEEEKSRNLSQPDHSTFSSSNDGIEIRNTIKKMFLNNLPEAADDDVAGISDGDGIIGGDESDGENEIRGGVIESDDEEIGGGDKIEGDDEVGGGDGIKYS